MRSLSVFWRVGGSLVRCYIGLSLPCYFREVQPTLLVILHRVDINTILPRFENQNASKSANDLILKFPLVPSRLKVCDFHHIKTFKMPMFANTAALHSFFLWISTGCAFSSSSANSYTCEVKEHGFIGSNLQYHRIGSAGSMSVRTDRTKLLFSPRLQNSHKYVWEMSSRVMSIF